MDFNEKGLLIPAKVHKLSPEEFKDAFVDSFPDSATRLKLYEQWNKYTDRFNQEITDTFIQWVGGSFTTRKINPNDVDLVTFLPATTFARCEEQLTNNFSKRAVAGLGLDVYFLEVRDRKDLKFSLWHSDYLYWYHQFSTSRKDRFGKKHARGFIQLTYNNFDYDNL